MDYPFRRGLDDNHDYIPPFFPDKIVNRTFFILLHNLYSKASLVWMKVVYLSFCSHFNTKQFWTQKQNLFKNKKHSENADTSTSVTFDLDVWPLYYVKVKKAYVIRCCVLYCPLVPDMMTCRCNSLRDMTICSFLWPLASVKVNFN